jgi:hypothetical protein
VEGATQYRVKVNLRVPEGPLLTSLDVVVREPRFELPHSPKESRVLLTARISAQCADGSEGQVSDPGLGGRFLLLKPTTCKLDAEPTRGTGKDAERQWVWSGISAASGYEVARFNPNSGLAEANWKVVSPAFTPPKEAGASTLYGIRPLCAGKPGEWAYVFDR